MSTFQREVKGWMMQCFSNEICRDIQERNHRFLEEALELVQSLGCTKEEVIMLLNYTFNRPVGEPASEVGGVMVTLAALCNPTEIDMMGEAEKELLRISSPEMIKKIQDKQATKPKNSPLPTTPIPVKEFNFYDNTLAMSFANPTGDPKAEMKSDFALEGNSVYLINALIEKMEKHPEVAEVITNAAYNYLERNKV